MADLNDIATSSSPSLGAIMLDDRRDSTATGPLIARRWDGPGGYLESPPEGIDIWPEQPKQLTLPELVNRLVEPANCLPLSVISL